jgi:outer membrane protein TolC
VRSAREATTKVGPYVGFRAAVVALVLVAGARLKAEDAVRPMPSPVSPDLVASVTAAPSLAAARARVEAARARLDAAGRFPDPEIEGMVSRKDTPDEVMPMYELNFRQPLPKSGERAADQDRATAVVAMAEAEFALMAGEMTMDVAMALAEAETAGRRIDALTTQVVRTEQVLAAVDARIATGQARLGDRLALLSRIASMQLMIEQERRMADDALSQARGLLGLRADEPLPALVTLPSAQIDPDHAPALIVAGARRSEAEAMGRMARASARPMTAVGLRLEREEERMGNNDTIGIAFMTELPWRSRRYARAEERAAQAEASAAVSDAEAERHRITTAVSRVERAERVAETSRRLGQETQQRLNADLETLVNSAGTGGMGGESTVLMILEILEKATDAQLQVIDAEGSAIAARAALWRYAPVRNFSDSTTSSP